MSQHNHVKEMIKLLKCLSVTPMEPEAVISFYVQHENKCSIRAGKFCDCKAVIALVPPGYERLKVAMLRQARELKEVDS